VIRRGGALRRHHVLVLERCASFVPAFHHPERFAEGEAAQAAVTETGLKSF
jgi:hypothetical protein